VIGCVDAEPNLGRASSNGAILRLLQQERRPKEAAHGKATQL
jgi:hypothetical protein